MKCCNLTSGMLRTKVSLQSLQRTPDGAGGVTEAWVQYATPNAQVKPMSGGELLRANRLDATGMARVFMRYRSDMVESDKMVIDSKDYQIRSIVNIEMRNKWLEVMVERGVAQ